MTTNLLSAIEQQQKALKDALYSLQVPLVSCQAGAVKECVCRKCVIERGDLALAAGKQALEQTQGEACKYADMCNEEGECTSGCAERKNAQPVAYVVFASNGNIRIWGHAPDDVKRIKAEFGSSLIPLYTHHQPSEQPQDAASRAVPVTKDDAFVKLGVMYMKLGLPKLSGTEFVAWCARWFGADSDESYLSRAVGDLLGTTHPQPIAPAPITQGSEPAPSTAGEAERLYDAIKECLLSHRLQTFIGEDGDHYPLVDHLSHGDSIADGQHEIALICDCIYNEVLKPAALLSAPALPVDVQERDTKTFVSQIQPEMMDKAALPVGELKPVPPNETGATHCVVRWMVETPKGWLGAYDKDAFSAYIAAARTQPVREPMTDEELDLICEKALFCRISFQQFARSIEAAHGITKKGGDQPER